MFEYHAKVVAVYDADTITVHIDLGFKAELRGVKLRLFGIDAPEMRGPEKADGRIARDWLRERILDKQVRIKSHDGKDFGVGKYGRWLAEVFPVDGENVDLSFNDLLVEEGLAQHVKY